MPLRAIILTSIIIIAVVLSVVLLIRGMSQSGGGHLLGGLPAAFAIIGVIVIICVVVLISPFFIWGLKKGLIILGVIAGVGALTGLFFIGKSYLEHYMDEKHNEAYNKKLSDIRNLPLDDLLKLAKDSWQIKDYNEYQAVFSGLSDREDKSRILPVLVSLAEDCIGKEEPRKFPLAEALGSAKDLAVTPLVKFSKSQSADIRWYAAVASKKLAEVKNPRPLLAMLGNLVKDKDEIVAELAAISLSYFGDDAVPYMKQLLSDTRPALKMRAEIFFEERQNPR